MADASDKSAKNIVVGGNGKPSVKNEEEAIGRWQAYIFQDHKSEQPKNPTAVGGQASDVTGRLYTSDGEEKEKSSHTVADLWRDFIALNKKITNPSVAYKKALKHFSNLYDLEVWRHEMLKIDKVKTGSANAKSAGFSGALEDKAKQDSEWVELEQKLNKMKQRSILNITEGTRANERDRWLDDAKADENDRISGEDVQKGFKGQEKQALHAFTRCARNLVSNKYAKKRLKSPSFHEVQPDAFDVNDSLGNLVHRRVKNIALELIEAFKESRIKLTEPETPTLTAKIKPRDPEIKVTDKPPEPEVKVTERFGELPTVVETRPYLFNSFGIVPSGQRAFRGGMFQGTPSLYNEFDARMKFFSKDKLSTLRKQVIDRFKQKFKEKGEKFDEKAMTDKIDLMMAVHLSYEWYQGKGKRLNAQVGPVYIEDAMFEDMLRRSEFKPNSFWRGGDMGARYWAWLCGNEFKIQPGSTDKVHQIKAIRIHNMLQMMKMYNGASMKYIAGEGKEDNRGYEVNDNHGNTLFNFEGDGNGGGTFKLNKDIKGQNKAQAIMLMAEQITLCSANNGIANSPTISGDHSAQDALKLYMALGFQWSKFKHKRALEHPPRLSQELQDKINADPALKKPFQEAQQLFTRLFQRAWYMGDTAFEQSRVEARESLRELFSERIEVEKTGEELKKEREAQIEMETSKNSSSKPKPELPTATPGAAATNASKQFREHKRQNSAGGGVAAR